MHTNRPRRALCVAPTTPAAPSARRCTRAPIHREASRAGSATPAPSCRAAAHALALCLGLGAAAVAASNPAAVHDAAPELAHCADDHHATVLQPATGAAPAHARAAWADRRHIRWPGVTTEGRFRLLYSANASLRVHVGEPASGIDEALPLAPAEAPLTEDARARVAWLGEGATLALVPHSLARMPMLHRGQLLLVREDAAGHVLDATRVQHAGALDDLYAAAAGLTLGAAPARSRTRFALWAPTAWRVSLCLYPDARAAAAEVMPMQRDPRSGAWLLRQNRDLTGYYYAYLVDVHVPGQGLVRNRVTDPYAVSLSADSRRAWIGSLRDPALAPPGWDDTPAPQRDEASTDTAAHELHVREFSQHDARVPPAHRGTWLAFTHPDSDGMRRLRALAQAGLTDVHLLPVFDFVDSPTRDCVRPKPKAALAADAHHAPAARMRSRVCDHPGYSPLHYTAPEGSYSTDPHDGALQILEFRRMVQALHRAGLRVGMHVAYDRTSASGQAPDSVLDRIVPGYYHRLDHEGAVTTSTCCASTATGHRMMAKLIIDSVATWAREHRIDAFRLDTTPHPPRAAMPALQQSIDAAAGRPVQLIGEGWHSGDPAEGASSTVQ